MFKKINLLLIIIGMFYLVGCTFVFDGDSKSVYNIVYNQGLPADPTKDAITVKVKDGLMLPQKASPSITDYTFLGWTLEDTNDYFDVNYPIHSSANLYAKWCLASLNNYEKDILDLNFSDNNIISKSKLSLPEVGKFGTHFIWSSSNTDIINLDGVVDNPGEYTQAVELTCQVDNHPDKKFNLSVVSNKEIDKKVTSHYSTKFVNNTEEYKPKNSSLTIYNINHGKVPYVSVEAFFKMLNGVLQTNYVSISNKNGVSTFSYTANTGTSTVNEKFVFNFNTNEITTNDYDFFGRLVKQTSTNFNDKINYGESITNPGTDPIYSLNDYSLELITKDVNKKTEYLIPLALANIFILSTTYYSVYYDFNQLTGIYFNEKFTNSSIANGLDIPADIVINDYYVLAFILDNFYGLSTKIGLPLTYKYRDEILNTSSITHQKALGKVIYQELDEMHSSINAEGMYKGIKPVTYDYGVRRTAFISDINEYRSLYQAAFPAKPQLVRYSGNLAIITLEEFVTDGSSKDADKIMENALKSINGHSNINKIILDISQNTGGNLGAVFRVLGYMTNDNIIYGMGNPLTGGIEAVSISIDTQANSKYKWYILTSPMTFSAANYITALAKNQGIATIIGQNSGGGACSISPFILSSGTLIILSSNNKLLSVKMTNNQIVYDPETSEVEYGIAVDYEIDKSHFYDDSYLSEFVSNH